MSKKRQPRITKSEREVLLVSEAIEMGAKQVVCPICAQRVDRLDTRKGHSSDCCAPEELGNARWKREQIREAARERLRSR